MKNLTELEIEALGAAHNLADGHAYRSWSELEASVVESAARLLHDGDRSRQAEIERDYLATFFALSGQTFDPAASESFFCFTASSAIEAIANHCRIEAASVALVEPCFDNLGDIMQRHGVDLRPLPESLFDAPGELEEHLARSRPDAVFLVSPNNPTGRRLDRDGFAAAIAYCARYGATLILDACFRFYLEADEVYDQYAMLIESEIDWIVIEDTGKTWPTVELKAPFFSVSRGLARALGHIYSDFLLHVSPFSLLLVKGFLEVSAADGFAAVLGPISENRRELDRRLGDTVLANAGEAPISLAWLRIEAPMSAAELTRAAAQGGIHILPGDRFHWSDRARGSEHVRIALARDPALFRQAAERLAAICRQPAPRDLAL